MIQVAFCYLPVHSSWFTIDYLTLETRASYIFYITLIDMSELVLIMAILCKLVRKRKCLTMIFTIHLVCNV